MTPTTLKTLQVDIRAALADPDVSAGAIVEIMRETLLMEANKARAMQQKATEAVELLKVPALYAPSSSYEDLYGTQAAQPVDNILETYKDVISFTE